MTDGETRTAPTASASNADSLYERDFYTWTQEQAALLRAGKLSDADLPNIIEEIETLGRSERNALRSRYAILCMHLLKSKIQPEREGPSWTRTIVEQRIRIARLLDDNPGLRAKRDALFRQGYDDARKMAAAEMGMSAAELPEEPPFTMVDAETEPSGH